MSPGPSAALRALCALSLGMLAGCSRSPVVVFERASADAFTGHAGDRKTSRGFDIVAADVDQDGDPDVLINWHHLAPLELFENRGGRFPLLNPPDDDRSGLHDNAGITSLYAPTPAMKRRAGEVETPGLCLWHDLNRRDGSWRFVWRDPAPATGLRLELQTSLEILEVTGLGPRELERQPRSLTLTIDGPAELRAFAVRTVPGGRLHLRATSAAGEAVIVFVGRQLVRCSDGMVDVWEGDPHGVAVVDIEGSPQPEIYITRGGLMGKLVPPLAPKTDRLFESGAAGGSLYHLPQASRIPADYGRGRRVEWVDIDQDGQPELSVSNKGSPNKLLRRGPDGHFTDVAPDRGLDLEHGEVQCWGDHDGDGRDDLYYVEDTDSGGVIHLLRNTGARFERLDGRSLGLVFGDSPASMSLFNFAALRLADCDNDGNLDLWLLMHGEERTNHLFRRDGDGFVDVTETWGLGSVSGNIFTVLFDADNDGREDAVSSGVLPGEQKDPEPPVGQALLWRNRGDSFEMQRLPYQAVPLAIHCATDLDADGDGRMDLVAIGVQRSLLRNRTESANGFVTVSPLQDGKPAIGAVVRLHFDDGTVCPRRLGSAHNSAYSQVVRPLHFGVEAGVEIEKMSVHWPGAESPTEHASPILGRSTAIER